MRGAARRSRRLTATGATMVEFSLVASMVFILMLGIIDYARAVNAQNTIADASRQAARQATANADLVPFPFGSYTAHNCSGTTLSTGTINNAGCLTDAALLHTVQAVMASQTRSSSITLKTSQSYCTGSANGNPAAGSAWVCISPADGYPDACPTCTSMPASPTACAATTSPSAAGTLVDRYTEWNSQFGTSNRSPYRGCFLVEVSIVYAYKPLTPVLGAAFSNGLVLRASTTIVAEY